MNEKKVWVFDLEQFFNFHCATFLNRDNPKELQQFVIHRTRNDFNEYIEFLETQVKGLIGFNNINYDYPLIHYILTNKEYLSWDTDFTTKELYDKSQDIINEEWSSIPSWNTLIPQLDLYKIWHFDNKAKRTSLKAVEIAINFNNVEDLPFEFNHHVQDNEVDRILSYNLNDVLATYEFYKITIGDTELPLYKGKDKLQLRKDVQTEFDIDCINYNDVKIGDEINKFNYLKATKKQWKEIKGINTQRDIIYVKDCISDYISFESDKFKEFLDKLRNKTLSGTKGEFEEVMIYKGVKLTFAQGGLHSDDKARKIIPKDNELLEDRDCASMYPTSIINLGLYPEHLGIEWLYGYIWTIDERIKAKGLYKKTKNKKYESIAETYKLGLNGGGFGKTGEPSSWQYDPLVSMKTTIGNQLSIAMLCERYLDNDIQVISVNTDGILILFDKEQQEKISEIDKWWQSLSKHTLEYTPYKLFVQTSVNSYVAVKLDGELKLKNEFEIDKEIHKDHSMKIVPIALVNYFVHNIPIRETIINHNNIFNFCKRFRSTEGWTTETRSIGYDIDHLPYHKIDRQQKNIRYYMSNKGSTLMKVHNDGRESNIEKGWIVTIMNRFVEKPIEEYNINYQYYISKCNKIIDVIEDKQLTLF